MKMPITTILALVWASLVNVLFAQNIEAIVPIEAKKMMDKNEAIFIDVREVDELLSGTIKESINIPMSLMNSNSTAFNQQIEKLPLNKQIIVFCRSGRRSNIVGGILKKKGYKVLNLGGYENWKKTIL